MTTVPSGAEEYAKLYAETSSDGVSAVCPPNCGCSNYPPDTYHALPRRRQQLAMHRALRVDPLQLVMSEQQR